MSEKDILAIDFGTVNTYFCKCPSDKTSPAGVDFGHNRDGIASAILYRGDKAPLIGDTALEEYGDATIEERQGYTLKTQFKPNVAESEEARGDSIEFLRGVLDAAKQANLVLSPEDRHVIIGVPSESGARFRASIGDIAREAGYGDVELVDEPKGALHNHISRKDISASDALKGVLVVDFGGGTCDFAFMNRGLVSHSWGDMDLGGRVFDDLFFQWFLDENPEAYDQMVANGDLFYVQWVECREMKEKFSRTMIRDDAEIFKKAIPEYGRLSGCSWDDFVKRARSYLPSRLFQEYLTDMGVSGGRLLAENGSPIDLFEWFRDSLMHGFDQNRIELRDVQVVILAGGSSLWSFVSDMLIKELPLDHSQIIRSDRPYATIANGLAILPALGKRLEITKTELREELPGFIKSDLKPLIASRFETIAVDISERIAIELYDQKIMPILTQYREEGGSVSSLEERLTPSIIAYEIRIKTVIEESMKVLSEGLPVEIKSLCAEWFARHGLASSEDLIGAYEGEEKNFIVDGTNIYSIMGVITSTTVAIITGIISAMVCGGGGMALIASGPIGWIIGLIAGAAAGKMVGAGLAETKPVRSIPFPAMMLKMVIRDSKLVEAREKLKDDIVGKIKEQTTMFEDAFEDQITAMTTKVIDSLSELNQT